MGWYVALLSFLPSFFPSCNPSFPCTFLSPSLRLSVHHFYTSASHFPKYATQFYCPINLKESVTIFSSFTSHFRLFAPHFRFHSRYHTFKPPDALITSSRYRTHSAISNPICSPVTSPPTHFVSISSAVLASPHSQSAVHYFTHCYSYSASLVHSQPASQAFHFTLICPASPPQSSFGCSPIPGI